MLVFGSELQRQEGGSYRGGAATSPPVPGVSVAVERWCFVLRPSSLLPQWATLRSTAKTVFFK